MGLLALRARGRGSPLSWVRRSLCPSADTPIMSAAGKGSVPLVALLLGKQADVNVFRRGTGASPLSVACEGGHREARTAPKPMTESHRCSPSSAPCCMNDEMVTPTAGG